MAGSNVNVLVIYCYSILTGSYDGVARVWNTSGELLLDTVRCVGHSGQPIKCVTWISDGLHSYFLLIYSIFNDVFFVICIMLRK